MRLVVVWPIVAVLTACGPIPVEQPAPPVVADPWRLDLTPMERGTMLQVPAFHDRSEPFRQDVTRLEIEPGEGMELKYRLETGDTVLYAWEASLPLHVEMHSQPDGAPFLYANSLRLEDELEAAQGSFTAPYPGIHGWFWENRTIDIITVTLTSAGFYREKLEFRAGQEPIATPIE